MWIRCVLFYPPWLCWILFCGWDRIAILDLLFANEVVEVTVFDTENLSCRSRIFCSYGTIKILLRHVDAHFLVIASWIPPINKFSRGEIMIFTPTSPLEVENFGLEVAWPQYFIDMSATWIQKHQVWISSIILLTRAVRSFKGNLSILVILHYSCADHL